MIPTLLTNGVASHISLSPTMIEVCCHLWITRCFLPELPIEDCLRLWLVGPTMLDVVLRIVFDSHMPCCCGSRTLSLFFVTALHQRFTILQYELYVEEVRKSAQRRKWMCTVFCVDLILQHRARSLPTAKLTVTSKDRAPFGRICPGSRTWVAPRSSSAYAGPRACDPEKTFLAHLSGFEVKVGIPAKAAVAQRLAISPWFRQFRRTRRRFVAQVQKRT